MRASVVVVRIWFSRKNGETTTVCALTLSEGEKKKERVDAVKGEMSVDLRWGRREELNDDDAEDAPAEERERA